MEEHIPLAIKIERLNFLRNQLEVRYRRIRVWFWGLWALRALVFVALVVYNFVVQSHIENVVNPVFLFLIMAIFFIIHYFQMHVFMPMKREMMDPCLEAMKTCNHLVDMVDWSSFRDRPDTNPRMKASMDAISDFYALGHSPLFLYFGANHNSRKINRRLALAYMIMTFMFIYTMATGLYYMIR